MLKIRSIYRLLTVLSLLIILPLFLSTSLYALDKESILLLEKDGHSHNVIKDYSAVGEKVNELLKKEISSDDILILTDWDDVINAPGTWLQKDYRGEYFCSKTKRMLLEDEVDGNLRDQNVIKIQDEIKNNGVRIVVFTARSAVSDEHLPDLVNDENILDKRHSERKDEIDYDYIINATANALKDLKDEEILEYAEFKVNKMIQLSGVDLRKQNNLPDNFVEKVEGQGRKMVYHEGYTFTGHNKGPFALSFLQKLEKIPAHLIIVDDSPRAIKSYYSVSNQLKEFGIMAHLLHYPTGG